MAYWSRTSAELFSTICALAIIPWLTACPPGEGNDSTTGATETTGGMSSTQTTASPTSTDPTTDPTLGTNTVDTVDTTDTDTTTGDPTDSETDTDETDSETTGLGDVCNYMSFDFPDIPIREVTVLDVDGDQNLDIATKWYPYGLVDGSTFTVHHGDGSGTVFTPSDEVELDHWERMIPGDFNGDGWTDLAHHIGETDTLLTQLNNQGSLQDPVESTLMSLFYALIVKDIDGDGNVDLTYGGYHGEPAKLSTSVGDGTFTQTHQFSVPACYVTAGTWADFDSNGELDFAVVGDCNAILGMPEIAVHLQSDGVFATISPMSVAHAADPSSLVAGDFTGDGIVDLAVSGGQWPWDANAMIEILPGNGDGTFANPVAETFELGDRADLFPADVDHNDLQDLFVAVGGSIQLLVNDGGDSFERCVLSEGDNEIPRFVGDFNNDGVADLLTTVTDLMIEDDIVRIWLSQGA